MGEWPPYVTQEHPDNGPIAKLVIDAFTASGMDSQLEWLPWARALRKTAKAQINATFPWYRSQQREQKFLFSAPLMTESNMLFHNKSLKLKWKTLEDLKGYRIGGNTDYFYSEAFSRAEQRGNLDVTRVDTEQQLIEMLQRGRLDIVLMTNASGHIHIANALAEEVIVAHPQAFSKKPLYALFPKADPLSPERLAAFNKGLRKVKARQSELVWAY